MGAANSSSSSTQPHGHPSVVVTSAVEDATLHSAFAAREAGWLGGDSSTSIRLTSTEHLWLFADTLWGKLDAGQRHLEVMPHNTLALVADGVHPPHPRFIARRTPSGDVDARGFFHPLSGDVDSFYWLVAATMLPRSGKLFVLAQVQGPNGLDDFRGTDAIVVDVGDAEPAQWPYSTSRIAQTDKRHSWNCGVHAAADGYVYLLGMRENGEWAQGRTQHLARIGEEALLRFEWKELRFWAGGDDGWSDDDARAATLFDGPYTEGTLQRHASGFYFYVGCQARRAHARASRGMCERVGGAEARGLCARLLVVPRGVAAECEWNVRWSLQLVSPTAPSPSPQAYQREVMLYTASSLTGPWASTLAYTIPPLSGERVAYAAKSHPELARDDEIVFTYNVNSPDASDVMRSLDVYIPRFVRLTLELQPPPAAATEREEL